jgi:integrase
MHALRHYYASVLLEDGVTVRTLADYLGHVDPGFTLRVYAHLMPAAEGRAREAVDAALGRRRMAQMWPLTDVRGGQGLVRQMS